MESFQRWVQSKYSPDAKKWPLVLQSTNGEGSWIVEDERHQRHALPQSEYNLCEPPEEWVNVSGQCYVDKPSGMIYHRCSEISAIRIIAKNAQDGCFMAKGYRQRMVEVGDLGQVDRGHAFIIEKLKQR